VAHRPNAVPQSAVQRDDFSAMATSLTPSQLRAALAAFREREARFAAREGIVQRRSYRKVTTSPRRRLTSDRLPGTLIR
jgi:hypothetical protein